MAKGTPRFRGNGHSVEALGMKAAISFSPVGMPCFSGLLSKGVVIDDPGGPLA